MSEGISDLLKLKVITPNQLLVDEEAHEVGLPGLDGCLGILPGHSPLLVTLGEGNITYRFLNNEKKVSVNGGYAEVLADEIQVFTKLKDNNHEQDSDEGRG
jgi:F-type H+-transporting ATPase subunit epsilon